MSDERENNVAGLDGGEELQRILDSVKRRWLWGLVTLLISVALGIALTLTSVSVYRASSSIVIEQGRQGPLEGVSDVYDPGGGGGYWSTLKYMETQYKVLASKPVMRRTAENLGLDEKSIFDLWEEGTGEIPASVLERLVFLGIDPKQKKSDIRKRLRNDLGAKRIASAIAVKPVPDTQIVKIIAEDVDRDWVGRVANAVAESYIEYNYALRLENTKKSLEWLTGQSTNLRELVESLELEVSSFKKKSNSVSLSLEDRRNIMAQMLSELSTELTRIQAQRMQQQGLLSRIENEQKNGNTLDALGDIFESELLTTLRIRVGELRLDDSNISGRYTSEHPKRVALASTIEKAERAIVMEVRRKSEALRNYVGSLAGTEAQIKREIEKLKSEALSLNERGLNLNRLTRELQQNGELYDMILKRQKEVELAHALEVNNVRIFELSTEAGRKIRPRPVMNFGLSLFAGVILAFFVMLMADLMDHSLRDITQLESLSKLPVLGIVPTIEDGQVEDAQTRDLYPLLNPKSNVAEACRSLRTNLNFLLPSKECVILLVTSSQPKEGKSTLATHLSATMALANLRTLLVDTDMRRPRLHKAFGLDVRKGVSGVIAGLSTLDESICKTDYSCLDILPCGAIPPNPAELIGSPRFEELVSELSKRYDRVIFDSPPVNAVTDSLLISKHTHGVILIAKQGSTSAHAFREALRKTRAVGANLTGVVFNSVSNKSGGYGRYYGQYYTYYGEDEAAKAT